MRLWNSNLAERITHKLDLAHDNQEVSVPELVKILGLKPQRDLVGEDFRNTDFRFNGIKRYDLTGCDLRDAKFDSKFGYPKGFKAALNDKDQLVLNDETLNGLRLILEHYYGSSNAIDRLVSLVPLADKKFAPSLWDLALSKLLASPKITKIEKSVLGRIQTINSETPELINKIIPSEVCAKLLRKKPLPFQRFSAAVSLSEYKENEIVRRALEQYYAHAKSYPVLRFLARTLSQ